MMMKVLMLLTAMALSFTTCNPKPDEMNMFKSKRISQTAEITVNATPDKAFSLFGPIEEKRWAHGWNPEITYGENGTVEEGMVFKTKGHGHGHGEDEFIWAITKYSPSERLIVYSVHTQHRIWFITIQCTEADQNKTKARITYTYTGLTEEGNKLNEVALSHMYQQNLKDWEKAINYYLETGTTLVEGH